ncbi:uncharacterized protein LOC117315957 [Pecten maximus]|uniref:uncharacterized protein LOC117315957 n=1 Tax=Pecten maximus TaxID=6579 RepID=UPI00145871B2|nr:uncharacterized protein LOC117315957 [Pecten maximus]
MVLRCAWGTCTADERYPDRMNGARFILFPKPKTNLDKCLRWIKACGRPHDQLNVDRINKHKAVCSKHFEGGDGPTSSYPDPLPADGSKCTPTIQLPVKKRTLSIGTDLSVTHVKKGKNLPFDENTDLLNCQDKSNKENLQFTETAESSTQTDENWVSPLDILSMASEIHHLKAKNKEQARTIEKLEEQFKEKTTVKPSFGVTQILGREGKLKNLHKYYTGITCIRFAALLSFLVPPGSSISYEKGRRHLKELSNADGLFLTLCRLRHNFGLKDLAVRFGLTLQATGVVFNTWIEHMYFKLGQLPIWPHRDTIIGNMPSEFRRYFPTSLIIIDGTELRTQTPCGLGLQSQLYSDYKSSTTLKGLVGCDPNGTIMFISELHSGAISDKSITEESGFYETLNAMKDNGFVCDGDAIMADKGFKIIDNLHNLGLRLNIPPFAKSGAQMSCAQVIETQKIAKHRVHIERLIAKIKTYKIVSHRVPTALF